MNDEPGPAPAAPARPPGLEASGLAAVIGDGPAAVLLVDLRTREVVHASPVAEQLAPGTALPISLDDWSDAAHLRDHDGSELTDTDHPLSRVARAEPVAGQAVSAARRSDLGSVREPLWVVAVPMTGAPELASHCLVVLLPLRDQPGELSAVLRAQEGADQDATLGERAILATGLSFTVADARRRDRPLVWVNPAFTATTGYELDDVIGRNCRFLQGPATDPADVAALREALDAGQAISQVLLNYRKDGTPFWNQLDLSPVLGPDGGVTHHVGIQTDVSARVDADRARDRALEAERVAREAAEAAQRRLRFLFDTVDRLTGSLDVAEVRRRLLDLVLPELADWALVLHRDVRDAVTVTDGAHADVEHAALVAELVDALPTGLREGPLDEIFLGDADVRLLLGLDGIDSWTLADTLGDPALADHAVQLGARSALVVALPGRQRVDDVMVLVRDRCRAQFDQDDVEVVRDLGRRVGLVLESARLLQVQTAIAETLQRSLLPTLPAPVGIDVAARYRAGEVGAEVGGDFYDVLDLPRDGVGFAIGDVAGHDIRAAAAMGHLQGLLRAGAHRHYEQPALVLQSVDSMLADLGMGTVATAVYGHLLTGVDGWLLRWASAGHPPLVLRRPDGGVESLVPDAGAAGSLLGLGPVPRRHSTRRLPTGTTLVAYTDGLVERRHEHPDLGMQRLLAAVGSAPDDAEALCDHVLAEMGSDHDDDVAVLTLTLGAVPAGS